MSYAEEVSRARRLAILLQLYFMPGYKGHAAFVRERVEHIGYTTSRDLMQTELAWLKEQGLIELDDGVATLTGRGEDVALGRTETPGVRKPGAGEVNR